MLRAHVDEAHKLGRVDGNLSGLLGNEGPAAEHGGVVDAVAHALAVELDIGWSLHFLAPESVESRELGVFESAYVDTVVELKGGA